MSTKILDVTSLKVTELKDELKKRGLAITGLKTDLIERLKEAVAKENGSADPPSTPEASAKPQKHKAPEEDKPEDEPEAKLTKKAKVDVPETKTVGKTEEKKTETPAPSSSSSVGKGTILDYLTEPGWKEALAPEFEKTYFKNILSFLAEEKKKRIQVFPPENEIFSAFNLTPLNKVKVVIIGQDPYHDDNQAHGLCFSVKKGINPPPSLKNIYKELQTDIKGFKAPSHGFLAAWARRGVLLLNATMTVQAHKANSHANCGWQQFTDEVIKVIDRKLEGVVFLLWGGFAQKKGKIINRKKHIVIESAHPSPLSASKWFGSKPFSKANEALAKNGKEPVDWNLPAEI